MEDQNFTSVETSEVAEPIETEVESVETQEVAEPVSNEEVNTNGGSNKSDSDAAFAQMRRELEAAKRENAQMFEALQLYFDGETGNDLSVQAQAYAQKRDPAEIQAELDRQNEMESLRLENEELKRKAQDAEVDRAINESLKILNGLDSEIKTIDDIEKLGDDFLNLISAGVDTETAFYAVQAKTLKNKVNAPSPIGKADSASVEKDYYTSDELSALSKDQIRANWKKVQHSMALLK